MKQNEHWVKCSFPPCLPSLSLFPTQALHLSFCIMSHWHTLPAAFRPWGLNAAYIYRGGDLFKHMFPLTKSSMSNPVLWGTTNATFSFACITLKGRWTESLGLEVKLNELRCWPCCTPIKTSIKGVLYVVDCVQSKACRLQQLLALKMYFDLSSYLIDFALMLHTNRQYCCTLNCKYFSNVASNTQRETVCCFQCQIWVKEYKERTSCVGQRGKGAGDKVKCV